jgi:predicted DNA-binding transcriptional regulator AlpA
MKNALNKLLSFHFRDIADKLDAGNTNVTEEEAINILHSIAHIALTKEEVCDKFKISRATFDRYVTNGYIPKGIKVKHKTSLIWYQDEVEQGLERLKR